MTYVTYNNIRLKCYIKVYAPYCIVRDVIGCSPILARAINFFYDSIEKINIKNKFYSFLEVGINVIVAPFSLMSTFHVNWSPFSMFSSFTKPIGTTVLKLPALYDMLLLNVTFIHLLLFVFTYIYIVINIYILCLFVMIFLLLTLQTFI